MHDSDFALDIDIFVLHSELGPDENHDGCCWLSELEKFCSEKKGRDEGYVSLSRRAGAETRASVSRSVLAACAVLCCAVRELCSTL